MERDAHGSADAALALYEELLKPSTMEGLRREHGFRGGGGLFSASLTVWLGIRRRLGGYRSVEQTWVGSSLEEVRRLSPRSSRAKKGALSPHASGFDYARHHLPMGLVELAADALFGEASALTPSGPEGRWFVLDGTSLSLAPSPSLARAFPAAENQYGPIHWLCVKVAVAHELSSGLAIRPEWGPMHGPEAVSEQDLAYRLIARLPPSAGVVADRNFGILAVAWALRERPMLVRLTDSRAKAMLGGRAALNEDVDVLHEWLPSPWERKRRPDSEGMRVSGRIVVRHVLGSGGARVRVCLFTNELSISAEDLVRLYAQRWNVETDLRTLKKTVDLELVGVKSPEMLGKELVLAVAAYNVVRAAMALAAAQEGVPARRLSFARAKGCLAGYARRGPVAEERLPELYRLIAGRKLPERREKRSFPREAWTVRRRYKPREQEVAG